jgi:hypothetical protein
MLKKSHYRRNHSLGDRKPKDPTSIYFSGLASEVPVPSHELRSVELEW